MSAYDNLIAAVRECLVEADGDGVHQNCLLPGEVYVSLAKALAEAVLERDNKFFSDSEILVMAEHPDVLRCVADINAIWEVEGDSVNDGGIFDIPLANTRIRINLLRELADAIEKEY